MEEGGKSKRKITLTEEKETLLVPLFSKACADKENNPIIIDHKASEILESINYDFEGLSVPRQTMITLAMRAEKIDEYVQNYINWENNENPKVLHLGCGLDSRILRVGFNRGKWYDIDYPDVIELRRNFYDETPYYRMVPSSVTSRDWLDKIELTEGPACIIAEGLFMYLKEKEIRDLFLDLQKRLPSSEIIFDAYSTLTAKGANRHPSIRKTGASIQWGIDNPREIETWGRGITLQDEWFFTESPKIASLEFWDSLLFKIMGLFNIAKRAHRILRFRL